MLAVTFFRPNKSFWQGQTQQGRRESKMLALQTVLLVCCLGLCPWHAQSASVTDEDTIPAAACESNSSSQLTFVTSLSIRGCPVFVHRLGEVKAGRFVLEPIFCITNFEALRRPSAHYDLLKKEFYFSFPVQVTDEMLLSEVESQLRHLVPKSIAFAEVTSIELSHSKSFAFKNASILWGPTESVGHVRLVCDRFACQTLAFHLLRREFQAFDEISLVSNVQVHGRCSTASVKGTYPITIASSPFLSVNLLQRPRRPSLRTCSDLQLLRAVHLGNCTAYVHRMTSRKGHFVIEPLLCPSANFSLLTDYSQGKHYLKIPAAVEDTVIAEKVVSSLQEYAANESIEFIPLWDADLHVSVGLNQWQIQPLRLSVDRKSAELRVYCANLTSCELLSAVLRSEPVNFWKNIQWTSTSVLADKCEFKSDKRRFAFRMKERESSSVQLLAGDLGTWDFLRNRTVTRNGRGFIVVSQRSCSSISNFQRTWKEYVEGFGDAHNFWMGLDVLNSLTSSKDTTMRVEMQLWNDTELFAEYSGFTVGSPSTKYVMNYIEMVRARSTLVFDAMNTRGYPFTTRDNDNDGHSSPGYCSQSWAGSAGWWFSSCGNANPNGVYSFGESSSSANAVWYFQEGLKALKEFKMLIQI